VNTDRRLKQYRVGMTKEGGHALARLPHMHYTIKLAKHKLNENVLQRSNIVSRSQK